VLFSTGLPHTELRAQSAPGFPCALSQKEGQRNGKTPDAVAPREDFARLAQGTEAISADGFSWRLSLFAAGMPAIVMPVGMR